MVITGDQLRMARAALKLTVREVSELAQVDKSTIVRIEAGGKSYYQTVCRLQAIFEQAGIVFIEPRHGVHGRGVCFKWGFEPEKIADPAAKAGTGKGEEQLDAIAWDEFDSDDVPLERLPALDYSAEERAEMVAHWRQRPEEWADLHEISRNALLKEIGIANLEG